MTNHKELKVGMEVGYHSYAWGWRYGKVIGLHESYREGMGTPELNRGWSRQTIEMATIRFPAHAGLPTEDHSLPCFRLDLSHDKEGNPQYWHQTHDRNDNVIRTWQPENE